MQWIVYFQLDDQTMRRDVNTDNNYFECGFRLRWIWKDQDVSNLIYVCIALTGVDSNRPTKFWPNLYELTVINMWSPNPDLHAYKYCLHSSRFQLVDQTMRCDAKIWKCEIKFVTWDNKLIKYGDLATRFKINWQ